MSVGSNPNPGTLIPGKIDFVDFSKPEMPSDDYTITVKQTVSGENIPADAGRLFQITREFSVAGPRFSLNPQLIRASFPPPGSRGQHAAVLPHVIFNRSTLPWERDPWKQRAGTAGDAVSWLALLVFHDDDFEGESPKVLAPTTIGIDELAETETSWFPPFRPSADQAENDKLTVIDVERNFLKNIVPSADDLAYLSHVRQRRLDDGTPDGPEVAVVLANRLPKPDGTTTVHLVSLENRYLKEGQFDLPGDGSFDFIRLVSLHNWTFACLDERYSFVGLLRNLDVGQEKKLQLRLPSTGGETDACLAKGFVPLVHHLRKGDRAISWYHGPLAPGSGKRANLETPVQHADQLIRYDRRQNMLDVSYAAAWQLGRMLTLRDQPLASALFRSKRAEARSAHLQEQFHDCCHLLPADHAAHDGKQPADETLERWFDRLNQLRPVPFQYLIPDQRMLPPESIRYFQVDTHWVQCLLDGAYSIGRTLHTDCFSDGNCRLTHDRYPTVTGFLLRSEVVAGWPDLQIDGYGEVYADTISIPPPPKLSLLRLDKLADDVLICMFQGAVKTVDLYQLPEALHFGFGRLDGKWVKDLKSNDGAETGDEASPTWRAGDRFTLEVKAFANRMSGQLKDTQTAAEFALQMLNGSPRMRFTLDGQTKPE